MRGWWVRYKFCICRVDGVRGKMVPRVRTADRGVVRVPPPLPPVPIGPRGHRRGGVAPSNCRAGHSKLDLIFVH